MLDMSSMDIDELLPLTPASFHILLVLAAVMAIAFTRRRSQRGA